MKFFVDTADVDEIRELAATGLLDGVTTNPSLVAKSGRNFFEVIAEICDIVPGPVSAEVAATDHATMLKEGKKLATIAPNVCVKVPLTMDGLKTCKALSDEGTKVNVTLCFSPAQALLAAKAGATFISPFVGRLDDVGHDGMALIADIMQIYRNYESIETEVLVASAPTSRPCRPTSSRSCSTTRSPTRASPPSSRTGKPPANPSWARRRAAAGWTRPAAARGETSDAVDHKMAMNRQSGCDCVMMLLMNATSM